VKKRRARNREKSQNRKGDKISATRVAKFKVGNLLKIAVK